MKIAQMASIVAQSIDDGAVGFSTNRFPPHVLPDGRSIPGTFADPSELFEIARVVGPRNALMQNVLDFSKFEETTELIQALARTSGGRVFIFLWIGSGSGFGSRRCQLPRPLESRWTGYFGGYPAAGFGVYLRFAGAPARGRPVLGRAAKNGL